MVMSGTHCIVEWCDAFIVGGAWIIHLGGKKGGDFFLKIQEPANKNKKHDPTYFIDDSLDKIKLSLQRGIQQQGQWVELDPEAVTRALRLWFLQVGAFLL